MLQLSRESEWVQCSDALAISLRDITCLPEGDTTRHTRCSYSTHRRREVLVLLVLKAKEGLENLDRLLVDFVLGVVLKALDLIQTLRLVHVLRVRVASVRPAQLLVRLTLLFGSIVKSPHPVSRVESVRH